jgi:hypothetical protein
MGNWIHVDCGIWRLSLCAGFGGTNIKVKSETFGYVLCDDCPKHVERHLTRKMIRKLKETPSCEP